MAFFHSLLNSTAVTKELKKDVNACTDFIGAVVKGHFLACACGILGVTSLDEPLTLPPGLYKASAIEQLTFINDISKIVIEHCCLVQGSLTNETCSRQQRWCVQLLMDTLSLRFTYDGIP